MKRGLLLFLSLSIYVTSCAIYRHKRFTYCNDGKLTGIDTIVKTEGFYLCPFYSDHDTLFEALFLYNDGSIGITQYFHSEKSIKKYFSKPLDCIECAVNWGHYKRFGDTIKAQLFYQKEALQRNIFESGFIVKGDTTILYSKEMCKSCSELERAYDEKMFATPKVMKFIPFDHKPDSSKVSFRNKKWYNCQ